MSPKRNIRQHILFTREEYDNIADAARLDGETFSSWLRRAARERLGKNGDGRKSDGRNRGHRDTEAR